MTPEAWSALTLLVARLLRVVSTAGELAPALRPLVNLLGRAVADQLVEPLRDLPELASSPGPDASAADGVETADHPAVAVWLTVDAARRLAMGERVKLAGAITAIEAWAETVPGTL